MNKVNPNYKKEIIKLYKKGWSYPKIAKRLNITTYTAWNHSKYLKINSTNYINNIRRHL